MKTYPDAITRPYWAIMQSRVFRTDGPDIDLPAVLIDLANACHAEETDEFIWSDLGGHTEATLGDLLIGAYWSLTEWHAGQWSDTYAALCAIGRVFRPGCTNGPEPESGEATAYELINSYFENQ